MTTNELGSQPVATHTTRRRIFEAVRLVAVICILLIFLLPLVWMLLASFKSNVDIQNTSRLLAFTPTLDNYARIFLEQRDFVRAFGNSALVAILSTGFSLLIGVPSAYAISRYRMTLSSGLVLMARIIPAISLLIPWYAVFSVIGLTGTYTALVLSHIFVSLPVVVWIMMAYFDSIPPDLEEAAQIDGLSGMGAFARVAVPLAAPGIATAGILSMIFSWNNFIFALVLSSSQTRTLPAAIFGFISYAAVDWGGLMAATVIVTLPVILVCVLAQRHIVAGLTAGASKG